MNSSRASFIPRLISALYPGFEFVLIVLACVFPLASGWSARIMTLEQSYRAALTRSETLANQAEQITQAEERYKQAIGSVLPAVNFIGSYFHQPSPAAAAAFFPSDQPLLQLQLTQPLFKGLREFAALHQTQFQKSAAVEAYNQARIQLWNDVAQAFYNVISLEKDLQDLKQEVVLYQKRIQELNERVRIGRSRQAETLTVQSSLTALQASIQQELGQITAGRAVWAFLTGLDPNTPLKDDSPLPKPPGIFDQYANRVEDRPDVRSQVSNSAASQELIPIARGANYPTIGFVGDYYFLRTGFNSNVNWDVQVQLTFPIYAGGTIESGVRVAASQNRQGELNLSATRRSALEEIRTIYGTYSADLNQINALRQNLEVSEKTYQVETRDYRLGMVTNLDVLQALTSYIESLRSLDKAIYTAKYDFNRLQNSAALNSEVFQ